MRWWVRRIVGRRSVSVSQPKLGRPRSTAGDPINSEALSGRKAVNADIVACKLWALAPHNPIGVDASHLLSHVLAHAKQDH